MDICCYVWNRKRKRIWESKKFVTTGFWYDRNIWVFKFPKQDFWRVPFHAVQSLRSLPQEKSRKELEHLCELVTMCQVMNFMIVTMVLKLEYVMVYDSTIYMLLILLCSLHFINCLFLSFHAKMVLSRSPSSYCVKQTPIELKYVYNCTFISDWILKNIRKSKRVY